MDPKPSGSAEKKVRGVYEHPKGSKIYWIQYFDRGRRHRERVGRKSDAIKLYAKRKTEILQGKKLPELQKRRVSFGELLDDAIAFSVLHHKSSYSITVKAELLREAFGTREAESIGPDEFSRWIQKRDVSPATFNRYRAFISLCYREAINTHKVADNIARRMRSRKEPRGRIRFLDRDEEYPALMEGLEEKYPNRVDEVMFSIFMGARLSEQFELDWQHVDFKRQDVTFVDTKNGEDRSVEMNSIVLAMMKRRYAAAANKRGRVFEDLREFCCEPGATFRKEEVDTEGFSPRWFRELCIERGIEGYTWHTNRHTFCSWLAIAGASMKAIQELAGHRTLQMTMRYAHLSPGHKKAEVEKLVAAPAKAA